MMKTYVDRSLEPGPAGRLDLESGGRKKMKKKKV
jgi:hypothetical protein